MLNVVNEMNQGKRIVRALLFLVKRGLSDKMIFEPIMTSLKK